jgi:hypothetical protein
VREEPRGAQADAADHQHLEDQEAHREDPADAADHRHLEDRAERRGAREVAVGRLLPEDQGDRPRRVGHRRLAGRLHREGRRVAGRLEVRRLACRVHLASQPWRRSPDRP